MSRGDRVIRWCAAVSVVVVAAIAAVISYGHAYELAVRYGESGAIARALPLTVDGLIVTCSLVLLDSARRGQRASVLAWFLLGCGVLATLGANVAHGLAHGPVGAVIAGWPALVVVGAFEMLARLIRGGPAVGQGEQLDEQPGTAAERDHDQDDGGHVRGIPVSDGPQVDEALAALVATARDRFAETLAAGGLPSVRALRRELHVGHPRAAAVRAALEADNRPGAVATTAAVVTTGAA
ncbi:MAG: DUF2637 domain-containing protein [Actinomadura rubrobrunea]|nr:DUF2637 domain-containing protein [Actinomadura rubrobrunea]